MEVSLPTVGRTLEEKKVVAIASQGMEEEAHSGGVNREAGQLK